MIIPIVKLNKGQRKKHNVYQIEFTINGESKREVVGSNKKNPEIIRASIQLK